MIRSRSEQKAQDDSRFLLHLRFEEQAKRTPHAVALCWKDDSVTFTELKSTSDRVARTLHARNVCDGAAVGLHMERSTGFFAAVLGILKSNSAVVPLPPSYPEGRLREILSFSNLDAVIDDDDTRLNPSLCDRIVHFADLNRDIADRGDTTVGSSHQAAFVLCSSGSTGKPKMIVRSHRSFFHRLNWTWENWPYADDEVCCQKSHMTTTHAIYEFFEPLLSGISVHIIADETVRNLELFWETVRAKRISRLLIVPSMLQVSLDLPGFVAPPIKVVVLMGEYLHPRLAGRAVEAFPGQTKIFSIYGSTEASSTLVCDVKKSYRSGEELPLGKPISPDVQAHVLGPALEPVAAGESGLLHIAGQALFTEYFRNPALTASVFVNARQGDVNLFNTQDQVRLLADKSLQFVGRIDHTVKVRGFRVDLGEVERAILLHPDVKQAVVMLGDTSMENPPLLAFYTPETVDHPALYKVLRDRLPAYMVPSALVGLEAFPLTSSGKVNRTKLLEVHANRVSVDASSQSLSNSEVQIVEVWQKVLKHKDVHRDSSFFEIGGTSLSVFTAVHLLREAFQLERSELSDHKMYQFPTVQQLAAYIDGLKSGSAQRPTGKTAIAVTLKKGDPAMAPLFVIASSGGTLGAYERLSKTLNTKREIVGIRDPFIWGERDPTQGFQDWITVYLAAMRERQPEGPYYVCAFSSAGAFGYEIAQRLGQSGSEVALLLLIEPIGIGGEVEGDFGFRAFAAIFRGRRYRWLVRVAGWLRLVTGSGRRSSASAGDNNYAMTSEEFAQRVSAVRRDMHTMLDLSSLLELNSGLPFTMTEADFSGREPDQYLATFLARVKAVSPEIDLETIERILIQYYCLQLPATHFYRLKNYEGRVVIYEPNGPQKGLLSAYFRPHVRDLRMRVLNLGRPSDRARFVCENLSRSLRDHYRSMRDDTYVANLSAELAPLLE